MSRATVPWLVLAAAGTAAPARGDVTVSSDFEGGSAKVLSVDQEKRVVRLSPGGDPKEGWPCWWYARVDGLKAGAPLTVEVRAPAVKLPADGGGRGRTVGPGWALPDRAAVSDDGKTWRHTDPGKRDGDAAAYTVTPAGGTVYVAWGPPFTPKDAAALVAAAEKACPAAKGFELCRSNGGRPVPALRVREGELADAKRYGVWVEARQHAWEAGSSWVCQGFAKWLVGDDKGAAWVRQTADVYVVPVMDVDHVAAGQGGKESTPRDHNRDWSDKPHWAEVRAAQERLRGLAKEGRLDAFVDLHNPGPDARRPYFLFHPERLTPELGRRNQGRWLAAARKEVADPLELEEKARPAEPENKAGYGQACLAWVVSNGNPHTLAACLETPWNSRHSTPEGYEAVGRQLGRAVEVYLRAKPRDRD